MQNVTTSRSVDGSIKILWQSAGKFFEAGAYPNLETGRYYLCISTQAGCNFGCATCALTTRGPYYGKINLTMEELRGQIDSLMKELNCNSTTKIKSVGYMGMGEPLSNYKNVVAHIKEISKKWKMVGNRFTISTIGQIDKIKALAKEKFPNGYPQLQLSVHRIFHRERIVPYDKIVCLPKAIKACESYAKKTGTTVRANYVLLKGINDSEKEITAFAKLFNPDYFQLWFADYSITNLPKLSYTKVEKADKKRIIEIARAVSFKKFRKPILSVDFELMGLDIEAGCGQLYGKKRV